ncbi:pentatricopeptide repeat-containing protein At4g37170-like [Zingiber officinale]|uniref:pentatricopeptide repeat-containing protein At4g37170-like n=1 Tax=Zingiber officinale TaxID=94328 RepID=UPI001C4B8BD5|nr:pentatricopeptide repeat-containing protein At4g37170-like [Zingiber officinale]
MKPLPLLRLCSLSKTVSYSAAAALPSPSRPPPSFSLSPAQDPITLLCDRGLFSEAIDLLSCQRRLPPSAPRRLDISSSARRIASAAISSGVSLPLVLANRLLDLLAKSGALPDARLLFDSLPQRDVCSWNTLLAGYSFAGDLDEAKRLFDRMPDRDHFSWSTILSAHSRRGLPGEALHFYRSMLRASNGKGAIFSNRFTASSALAAATAVPCLRHGKEIHCHIVRMGFDSDAIVWSALSDMYAKCGCINDARHVFDRIADKDVVSWTTMIGRYFDSGQRMEGFYLFSQMLRLGVQPNEFTFAGVLDACSHLAMEGLGRQVHGYMTRIGYDPLSFSVSALVHMYSKCGNIEKASVVFKGMSRPDLVSWTSIICGCAQNGHSEEATRFFDLLLKSGTKPDQIVFIGVLSACAHAGFIDKGLRIFHSIKDEHSLEHTSDHYACVVDLLSRAGRFEEAEEIIEKMPMKPDKFLWASLLGGCRLHKNLRLGKRAAEALFDLEPENAASYVTLANIYAAAGMWDEVEKVRKTMDQLGVIKKPGSSWIEVKRKFHVFLVGDKSHPMTEDIYMQLDKFNKRMKEEGYVPDTDYVLHDVEDEQKEENLAYHSEKLSVVFGIIATPQDTPIKVFKNLRICGDCHTAIKFISRISRRIIIVRDSSRFHHFKEGMCSCRDYW